MTTKQSGSPSHIQAVSLTPENYRDYGDVISARSDIAPSAANMGTAKRFNFLAKLENLRPGKAEPNLCLFRCNPILSGAQPKFEIRLLERHLYSTQAFIPMQGAERFLVIVCLGKDQPDLSTLRAFVASKSQGMTYKPGVWHHPLVAMDHLTDFACLVWEDGSPEDCEVVNLTPIVTVALP